jgi:hypothetical protein
MAMARGRPSNCKISIIDESCFGEPKDNRSSNIILNAACFQVSQELALAFRSGHKCVERNCVSYFVRIEPLAT